MALVLTLFSRRNTVEDEGLSAAYSRWLLDAFIFGVVFTVLTTTTFDDGSLVSLLMGNAGEYDLLSALFAPILFLIEFFSRLALVPFPLCIVSMVFTILCLVRKVKPTNLCSGLTAVTELSVLLAWSVWAYL